MPHRRKSLPETLAIFPLPGALLLPRARLPLHVFEPRYLAMVEACLATPERCIGMIQPRSASEGAPLHAMGCAGRITAFTELDDGRLLMTLTGISRFRIGEEMVGEEPWRRIRPDWRGFAADLGPAESDAGFDRGAFLALLARYLDAVAIGTDLGSLKDAGDEMLVNALAMLCPFGPEERQALLEAPSLTARRDALITLMEFALRGASDGRQESVQ